jgi:hypothetical protein
MYYVVAYRSSKRITPLKKERDIFKHLMRGGSFEGKAVII